MNSKGEARKCFLCHKEGHFKKHGLLNKSKEALSSKNAVKTSEANVIDGWYDSIEVLIVSHRDIQDAWIMDSRYTYYMTLNSDFLINFQKNDRGKSYWVIKVPVM